MTTTRRFFAHYYAFMIMMLTMLNLVGMIVLLVIFSNMKAEGMQQSSYPQSSTYPQSVPSYAQPSMMDGTTKDILKGYTGQTPVNIHIYSINAYGFPEDSKTGQASPGTKPMNHVMLFENVYCCPNSDDMPTTLKKPSLKPGLPMEPIYAQSSVSTYKKYNDQPQNENYQFSSSSTESYTTPSTEISTSEVYTEAQTTPETPQTTSESSTPSYTMEFSTYTPPDTLRSTQSYLSRIRSGQKLASYGYGGSVSITVDSSSNSGLVSGPQVGADPPGTNSNSEDLQQGSYMNTGFGSSKIESSGYSSSNLSGPTQGPPMSPQRQPPMSYDVGQLAQEFENITKGEQGNPNQAAGHNSDQNVGHLSSLKNVAPPTLKASENVTPSDINGGLIPTRLFTRLVKLLPKQQVIPSVMLEQAIKNAITSRKINNRSTLMATRNLLGGDEIKHTSEGLNQAQTAKVLLDCKATWDTQDAHRCMSWKKAGYCETHQATRYLFCRRTCLC